MEWMKPFHSSRASALGTCGHNTGAVRRMEEVAEGRVSSRGPHGEFDISVLHLEVESGCVQVPIRAAVVCYRDQSSQIQRLYVLSTHTHTSTHTK